MKDKVVIITGASEGLGKTVASKLQEMGAKLALVSLDEEKLRLAADEIGQNTKIYPCDITEPEQIKSVVKKILSDFGQIDVLVNNAGVWTDEEIEKSRPEQRRKVIETNALGNIEFTKSVEPIMLEQKNGHILNVISTSGNSDTSSGDNTLWQTYGASKWAMSGFTRALKDSLDGTGIKVTGFYPGGFESNLYENANRSSKDSHNQPWMMKTEDVADTLIFCLTRPEDALIEKLVITKFTK